jgi:preprotein translocase YajC subunit
LININLLTDTNSNGLVTYFLLPLVLLVLVGGFVWSSYSARKRQKSTMEMINKLAPGAKIKTIGGICGVIVEINEEESTFVLETGTETNKSYIKFDKQAIYQTEPTKIAEVEEIEETEQEVSIGDDVTSGDEVSNEPVVKNEEDKEIK